MTLRQVVLLGLLLAGSAVGSGGPAFAVNSDPYCPMPVEMLPDTPAAPVTIGRLAAGKTVVIVALGGASTVGKAAGPGERAWPARLAAVLSLGFPSAGITVVNRSVAQSSAREMTERIASDILPLAPALVIWETGTVDAAGGADIDAFRDALQEGVDMLLDGGIEVVLMDMQYSRLTEIVLSLERYAAEMREVADANGIALFPRRDLMRHWAEEGLFEYTAAPPKTQIETARRLYECLGTALAEFLLHGMAATTSAR